MGDWRATALVVSGCFVLFFFLTYFEASSFTCQLSHDGPRDPGCHPAALLGRIRYGGRDGTCRGARDNGKARARAAGRTKRLLTGLGQLRAKPFGVEGRWFVPVASRVPAGLPDRGVPRDVESMSLEFGVRLEAGGWRGALPRSHRSAGRWCSYAALRWMRTWLRGRETQPWGPWGTARRLVTLAERNQGVFPPAGRGPAPRYPRARSLCY